MAGRHQKTYENSIAHVRSRIRFLETRRRDLLNQLTEVNTSLGECHAELAFLRNESSSVSALPYEILAKVLELARDSCLKDDPRLPRSEVTFSHVTRRWRQVALGVPSLWTSIHASPQRVLEELIAYLERSRASPLCIRLDLSLSYPGQRYTEPDVLLDIISPHASRWRRLVIAAVHEDKTPVMAVQLPDLKTPLLQHLSISNVIAYCTPRPTIFTGGAPLLSFLRLDCFLTRSLPRPLPVPFTCLTTLHLDDAWYEDDPMSYEEFTEFIGASAMTLTHLSMKGPVVELDPAVWPPAVIELPALRSIRMACDAATSHIFVAGISAPVLQSFQLKGVSDGMTQDEVGDFEEEVWKYLTQLCAFPVVDSLVLVDCSYSSWTFRHFAATYSTISHLTLINLAPNVLEFLLSPSGLGTIWPNVRSLSLYHGKDSLLKPSWIAAMVDARRQRGLPMDYIELDQPDLSKVKYIENGLHYVDLRLAEPYTWPEDLGYLDEDDDFGTILF